MRIDRLDLKNYRCFDDLHVEFDPQMTVLVAPNGSGKTAILDAVKVALWPYVAGFALGSTTNDVTSIQIDDVRQARVRAHEMDWRLPAEIHASGTLHVRALMQDGALKRPASASHATDATPEEQPWACVRYRESIKKNTKTKSRTSKHALDLENVAQALQKRIFSDAQHQPDDLPMLGYYGTGRLWAHKKLTAAYDKADGEAASRTFAYRDCLDPASSYKHFSAWYSRIFKSFRAAQIRHLEKRVSADTLNELSAPIRAIQLATDAMLARHTGWQELEYSEEYADLVLNHQGHGQLKASQLSDGIRNMLALVGDIAYRCYKLNAHLGEEAPKRTRGIVLIDEVDMHLHPSWQQTVVADLMEIFPRIQFIITTHSPQVLSTVRRENIRLLGLDVSGQMIATPPLAMSYGEPSGDVLRSVMQVDPQPPVKEKADLQRLTEWVDQGLYDQPEAVALYQQLAASLGEQHPQLQRLQRSRLRQKALKS